jgi:radical SAM superfamily enzyme YgiQ (UPF0313 family)
MLHEENIISKPLEDIDVRVGIIFPDYYENSLLSLGYQIIYYMLNERNDCFCERIVFPHTKSIETNTPLNEFDILSFSIHHTTGYFNMIEMLKKDGIPVLREDRTEDDPLIIAGGPCITANPMPVKDFIDICWIGEVENGLYEFVDTYKKFKKDHLEEFTKIEGLYVPKLNNPTNITLISDMNEKYHVYKPFTAKDEDNNIVNTIHLDVLRGCSHGCRFCMAGYLYKPSRETDFDKLIEIAEESRKYSGINKVSLVGPDLSDFSKFFELIKALHSRDFNVHIPSVRLEKITKELLVLFKNSRLDRFDIAQESIYKIRKSVNKDVPDDVIQNVVETAFDIGLNLKFLFLIGFPNETEEDIRDLAKYIKSILKTRDKYDKNLEVDFRISPVVPKPHTPFQWEPLDIDIINYKIDVFLDELSDLDLDFIGKTMFGLSYINYSINARFDFNSNEDCIKDYILSCGGSEVGELIMNKSYDSPLSEWENYFPRYEIGDELPWDGINLGYRDSFIPREHRKMLKAKTTQWCGESPCYNCKDNCDDNPFV